MTRPADALLEAALRLPDSERADLAARLLDSLDPAADEGVESSWADEIARRLDDLDRGRVRPIPLAEARRLIRGDGHDAPEAG